MGNLSAGQDVWGVTHITVYVDSVCICVIVWSRCPGLRVWRPGQWHRTHQGKRKAVEIDGINWNNCFIYTVEQIKTLFPPGSSRSTRASGTSWSPRTQPVGIWHSSRPLSRACWTTRCPWQRRTPRQTWNTGKLPRWKTWYSFYYYYYYCYYLFSHGTSIA